MAEHTPTPLTQDSLGSGFIYSGQDRVANCDIRDGGKTDADIEARVEFIVRAVNSHEDLLAAAREAEAALIVGGTETEQLGVREMLYEAILKAEEGEAS